MKVSTLIRIVSNGNGALEDAHEPVDVDHLDGPWLVVIRDEVTSAIAGVLDHEIPMVASAWAATEEWQTDGGDHEFLGPLVGELRDLARQARPPKERLYLRISL